MEALHGDLTGKKESQPHTESNSNEILINVVIRDSFKSVSLPKKSAYFKKAGAKISMIRFCPPPPPLKNKPQDPSEKKNQSLISEFLNKILEIFPFLFIPMHLLTNLGMRDVITHSEEARTHSGREESVELVSFTASSSKTKAVLAMI